MPYNKRLDGAQQTCAPLQVCEIVHRDPADAFLSPSKGFDHLGSEMLFKMPLVIYNTCCWFHCEGWKCTRPFALGKVQKLLKLSDGVILTFAYMHLISEDNPIRRQLGQTSLIWISTKWPEVLWLRFMHNNKKNQLNENCLNAQKWS